MEARSESLEKVCGNERAHRKRWTMRFSILVFKRVGIIRRIKKNESKEMTSIRSIHFERYKHFVETVIA